MFNKDELELIYFALDAKVAQHSDKPKGSLGHQLKVVYQELLLKVAKKGFL